MMGVDAAGLIRRALDFEPARGGVGFGRRGPHSRGRQPAFGQAEGIPAQSKAMAERQRGGDREGDGQTPAERRQRPERCGSPHGNAFRSSSK